MENTIIQETAPAAESFKLVRSIEDLPESLQKLPFHAQFTSEMGMMAFSYYSCNPVTHGTSLQELFQNKKEILVEANKAQPFFYFDVVGPKPEDGFCVHMLSSATGYKIMTPDELWKAEAGGEQHFKHFDSLEDRVPNGNYLAVVLDQKCIGSAQILTPESKDQCWDYDGNVIFPSENAPKFPGVRHSPAEASAQKEQRRRARMSFFERAGEDLSKARNAVITWIAGPTPARQNPPSTKPPAAGPDVQ